MDGTLKDDNTAWWIQTLQMALNLIFDQGGIRQLRGQEEGEGELAKSPRFSHFLQT